MISEDSPYIRIGGESTVTLLVDRIFELLDNLPELHELRQCFDQSLNDHREITCQLLHNALDSPVSSPDVSNTSLPLPTSARQLQQWRFCLQQALDGLQVSLDLQSLIIDNLTCCQLPRQAQVA